MIVGFNHNITYKGVGFHVQTEDSGVQKPHLITLLYHGGTIITSKKTVYADILKVENLEQVVEELAKEQHKGMLKRLTHGEFDSKIIELGISLAGSAAESVEAARPAAPTAPRERPAEPDIEDIAEQAPETVEITEEPIVDKFHHQPARKQTSLDDLIHAYLTAGQNT